ncbi:MAG TPA: lysophospholipid acyltransferase family protein [Blastocatellia bacterium]|nr:lysophospholipid acyltransferase family protein [Blastocatellia bacterium]
MPSTEEIGKGGTQFSTAAAPGAVRPGPVARLRYYLTFVVAALCFLILGVPVIPLGYLLRRFFGVKDFICPFGRFGARLYMRTAGMRIHVIGRERLDPQQPYVFVANHQSNLDPPLIFACVGRNPSFLVKKELFRIPVFAQGIRLIDMVPVDRTDRESALASTRLAAERLKGGRSYAGFPEGTRSADGRVREFKKGLFYMAVGAGVPVVPLVINDTRRVMRKGANYCVPGDVFMEILPPVSTAGYTPENIDELVTKVREQFVPRVLTD